MLLPNIHPFMRGLGPLLWLTDLAEPPTKESVGLQSTWISCDRMTYRYIVRCKAATHWHEVRKLAPREVVTDLEAFGQPEHWWVVRRPVTAHEFSFDTNWSREVARG